MYEMVNIMFSMEVNRCKSHSSCGKSKIFSMISLINGTGVHSLGKVSLPVSTDAGWCAMAWLNGRTKMAITKISNFECTEIMCSWIYLNIGFLLHVFVFYLPYNHEK